MCSSNSLPTVFPGLLQLLHKGISMNSYVLCAYHWEADMSSHSLVNSQIHLESQNIHYLSKYCIFHVQKWLFAIGEELRSIGIWAVINHRYNTSNIVVKKVAIFILKFLAPVTITSSSCTCHISCFKCKTLGTSMQSAVIVVITGTESQKNSHKFWVSSHRSVLF